MLTKIEKIESELIKLENRNQLYEEGVVFGFGEIKKKFDYLQEQIDQLKIALDFVLRQENEGRLDG